MECLISNFKFQISCTLAAIADSAYALGVFIMHHELKPSAKDDLWLYADLVAINEYGMGYRPPVDPFHGTAGEYPIDANENKITYANKRFNVVRLLSKGLLA
jgi:hypothetical protein